MEISWIELAIAISFGGAALDGNVMLKETDGGGEDGLYDLNFADGLCWR